MQEPSNDRLEQFFRKAAGRPDVTFNEDDWKKLEARLDAADTAKAAGGKKVLKTTATIIVGAVLLISTTLWINARYDLFTPETESSAVAQVESNTNAEGNERADQDPGAKAVPLVDDKRLPGVHENSDKTDRSPQEVIKKENEEGVNQTETEREETGILRKETESLKVTETVNEQRADSDGRTNREDDLRNSESGWVIDNPDKTVATDVETSSADEQNHWTDMPGSTMTVQLLPSLEKEKIRRELVRLSQASIERYKQKAVVDLPGAEGEETREAEAMVEEEHASDQTKHVATPRLSLLLSFAPDFSGTSIGQYSAPGKAYGAMVHYHLLNRWSISAGVIKNQKQYTGSGEDYKPPKGYWKYYTNGIIPETIDGSCSILEFPIMIQYTIHNRGKNKWLLGAGTSSYMMQSETYIYNFDTPNPGAKERWDSHGGSRFFFNMVNFTFGYERQVLPGLTLGLEPYAKIPLEEIGWSNLRLFSTGASITVRYTVLRKDRLSMPVRSRAPD